MGFSPEVAERALVNCGRCCCICHKFRGTKIELHHIDQKADGGDDSYENCIPLCLDCHADVKAYNPHHPKGRKYTESELRKHRDEWYKKRNNTTTYNYNEEHRQLDRELFTELFKLLHKNSFIHFIKTHNFTYPYKDSSIETMDQFLLYWDEPEKEFVDTEIESVRAELFSLVKGFSKLLSQNTFPINSKEFSIPDEWAWEQPERYNKSVLDLENLANQIYEKYCELVRVGQEKLSIRVKV